MDNRIGIRNAEGVSAWPELSISGRAYRRPCTTIGLDDAGHFVVIDTFPMPSYLEEIETLRSAIANMGAPPKLAKVKGNDGNA
jgi:hypothetical protein